MGQFSFKGTEQVINHKTIGWVSLLNIDQTIYLIQKVSILRDQNYLQWEQRLKELECRTGLQKTLFLPLNINKITQNSFCSGYDCYELIYQNFQKTLNEDIQQNRIKANLYSEYKIIKILTALARAGSIFEKKKLRMGIINEKNILFNQKEEVKIVTLYSSPILYNASFHNVNSAFLAPQQLHDDSLGQNTNSNACQAFVVGMILLQCMVSFKCHSLYRTNSRSICINWNAISALKRQIKTRYSQYLVKTVCQLLSQNPKSRKTLSEIHNQLQKNQIRSSLKKQLSLTNQICFNNGQMIDDNFEQTILTKDFNSSQVIFNSSYVSQTGWNRYSEQITKF